VHVNDALCGPNGFICIFKKKDVKISNVHLRVNVVYKYCCRLLQQYRQSTVRGSLFFSRIIDNLFQIILKSVICYKQLLI